MGYDQASCDFLSSVLLIRCQPFWTWRLSVSLVIGRDQSQKNFLLLLASLSPTTRSLTHARNHHRPKKKKKRRQDWEKADKCPKEKKENKRERKGANRQISSKHHAKSGRSPCATPRPISTCYQQQKTVDSTAYAVFPQYSTFIATDLFLTFLMSVFFWLALTRVSACRPPQNDTPPTQNHPRLFDDPSPFFLPLFFFFSHTVAGLVE